MMHPPDAAETAEQACPIREEVGSTMGAECNQSKCTQHSWQTLVVVSGGTGDRKQWVMDLRNGDLLGKDLRPHSDRG